MALHISSELADNPLRIQFAKILSGENFITPVVVDYVKRGRYICEISKERGAYCSLGLIGVTVVDVVDKKRCFELDTCFSGSTALREAREYINQISDITSATN